MPLGIAGQFTERINVTYRHSFCWWQKKQSDSQPLKSTLKNFRDLGDAVAARPKEAPRASFIINKNVTTVLAQRASTSLPQTRNIKLVTALKPQRRHSAYNAVVTKYACTHIIRLHRIIMHTAQSALSLVSGAHLLGESRL